jgi:hypothetical protein
MTVQVSKSVIDAYFYTDTAITKNDRIGGALQLSTLVRHLRSRDQSVCARLPQCRPRPATLSQHVHLTLALVGFRGDEQPSA